MEELKKLRQEIDRVDKKIIGLLKERFKITRKIGRLKVEKSLPLRDKKRERELFQKRKAWSKKFNLSPFLVEKIFRLILKEVLLSHYKIFSKKKR
ncbi:MAG: chorismate mutase [Minisyncoccales bacterium]